MTNEHEKLFFLARFDVGGDDHPHDITSIAEIDESEYTRLIEQIGHFERIGLRHMYRVAVNNYGKLHSLNTFYIQLFRQDVARTILDSRDAAFEFMTAMLNWINSVRIFIDHEQALYSRLYGKNSTEFTTFKDATAREYDNNIAYRFMYKFRNYYGSGSSFHDGQWSSRRR